jgi:hypothetical protein
MSAFEGFISEDDLDTFEGYLRLQAVDPLTTPPEQLEQFRKFFDEATASRVAAPPIPQITSKPAPGEFRYAIAVRERDTLWLTAWVKVSPNSDVYVFIPRNDRDWQPHTSYHRNGMFHSKSFDRKMLIEKRQPLGPAFRGCEHLGMNAGHGPKRVGAICYPEAFSGVIEVQPGILGPRDGFVAVDLVEPGCDPLDLLNPIIQTAVFRDVVPWIVIRIGKQAQLPRASS